MRLTWMIGGAQGTGIDTSATVFGNAIASAGYYVFGNREYYSNIKGRYPLTRISDVISYLIYNKSVENAHV